MRGDTAGRVDDTLQGQGREPCPGDQRAELVEVAALVRAVVQGHRARRDDRLERRVRVRQRGELVRRRGDLGRADPVGCRSRVHWTGHREPPGGYALPASQSAGGRRLDDTSGRAAVHPCAGAPHVPA